MCEENLRKKDQAYQRDTIEKDAAIREAEKCEAEKTELEKQKKESDETHERKLANAEETCASEASNNKTLSDALKHLSVQLDTVLSPPPLSGGEYPVDIITPIIEKVKQVVNVVSDLKSKNKHVQEQLVRLQTQYDQLQSQKQEDDATTRAQLKEAKSREKKIREEMKSKLKEQEQKHVEDQNGEKERMENIVSQYRERISNQSKQIQTLTSEREKLEAKSKHAEDLQSRLTDAENAMNMYRENSEQIKTRNGELKTQILAKDNECENKLTEQANEMSRKCDEIIAEETRDIIALHQKQQKDIDKLKEDVKKERRALNTVKTQLTTSREEAQKRQKKKTRSPVRLRPISKNKLQTYGNSFSSSSRRRSLRTSLSLKRMGTE